MLFGSVDSIGLSCNSFVHCRVLSEVSTSGCLWPFRRFTCPQSSSDPRSWHSVHLPPMLMTSPMRTCSTSTKLLTATRTERWYVLLTVLAIVVIRSVLGVAPLLGFIFMCPRITDNVPFIYSLGNQVIMFYFAGFIVDLHLSSSGWLEPSIPSSWTLDLWTPAALSLIATFSGRMRISDWNLCEVCCT